MVDRDGPAPVPAASTTLASVLHVLDEALARGDADAVSAQVNQMLQDRPSGALSALRGRLQQPTSQAARTQMVLGVIRMGEDALLREVAHALRHQDAGVVVGAARVLGLLGDARAVPNLIEAVLTDDDVVGRAVIEALGRIGDTVCVPWVVAAAEQGFCVEAACRALGALGDDRARPCLTQLAASSDRRVALFASQALVRLDERGDVPSPDGDRDGDGNDDGDDDDAQKDHDDEADRPDHGGR